MTALPDSGPLVSRRVLFFGGLALAVVLVYALRGVLLPLFLAFLVAYALEPLVAALGRRRVPRSVAAPLLMLALIGALLTIIFVAVPYMLGEFAEAARNVPDQLARLHARAEGLLLQHFNVRLPASLKELMAQYGTVLRDNAPNASKIAAAFFDTFGAIFVVIGSLIVPIFALYLLLDFDRIVARGALLIPRRWHDGTVLLVTEVHERLGRYVRGQIITNLILATSYAVGLWIVGLRLAIPIGILTGLLSFIPYAGVAIGIALSVSMALLDWHSGAHVLAVGAVMLTVALLDAMVITPRIVGGSVGLRPIEVLLTLMAAGTLFGFVGVLLAVPTGAVLKILLGHASRAYLASPFYSKRE